MKKDINYLKNKNKVFKCFYYALVIFVNDIVSKIPSRHFRSWVYKMLGVELKKTSMIYRNTELIYPYGITIEGDSVIGGHSLLDGRGGIQIGKHVNISSYVRLITGSHDVKDSKFKASFEPIIIRDYAWVASNATILQGVEIGEGSVVAAGAVVASDIPPYEIWGGIPAKKIGDRCKELSYKIEAVGLNTILH